MTDIKDVPPYNTSTTAMGAENVMPGAEHKSRRGRQRFQEVSDMLSTQSDRVGVMATPVGDDYSHTNGSNGSDGRGKHSQASKQGQGVVQGMNGIDMRSPHSRMYSLEEDSDDTEASITPASVRMEWDDDTPAMVRKRLDGGDTEKSHSVPSPKQVRVPHSAQDATSSRGRREVTKRANGTEPTPRTRLMMEQQYITDSDEDSPLGRRKDMRAAPRAERKESDDGSRSGEEKDDKIPISFHSDVSSLITNSGNASKTDPKTTTSLFGLVSDLSPTPASVDTSTASSTNQVPPGPQQTSPKKKKRIRKPRKGVVDGSSLSSEERKLVESHLFTPPQRSRYKAKADQGVGQGTHPQEVTPAIPASSDRPRLRTVKKRELRVGPSTRATPESLGPASQDEGVEGEHPPAVISPMVLHPRAFFSFESASTVTKSVKVMLLAAIFAFLLFVFSFIVAYTTSGSSAASWTLPPGDRVSGPTDTMVSAGTRVIRQTYRSAVGPTEYTLDQLSEFNGEDLSKPLLLAMKGKIYDVTASWHLYGPGEVYASFAGREVSAILFPSGVDEQTRAIERNWVKLFAAMYPCVGDVVDGS